MEEKKIELHDLARLDELVREIVQMHLSYIKKGFGTSEIAQTLAAIYCRRFEQQLDDEAMVILKKEQPSNTQIFGSSSPFETATRMCMNMATGFLRAVSDIMLRCRDRA